MGNNNEIRKRMETCRMVLLAVVWIAGITGMIGGIIMINESSYLKPFGIAIIIVSILGSIIGHFLVNVVLAIPFILLNNGDYLAAIVPEGKCPEGKHLGVNNKSLEEMTCDDNHWICGRCKTINESNLSKCKKCGW